MGRKQILARFLCSPDVSDCLDKPGYPVRKTRKINAHWLEKGMHKPEPQFLKVLGVYITCNAAALKISKWVNSLLPGFYHKVNDHHTPGN